MPIRNQTPRVEDIFYGLIGGPYNMGNPPARTCVAADGRANTYMLPSDQVAAPSHWMNDARPPMTFASSDNDDVEFYVDGPEAFRAMIEAIETASSSTHLILLAGWVFKPHLNPVVNGAARGPEVAARERQEIGNILLSKVTPRGPTTPRLRVVLWRPPPASSWAASLAWLVTANEETANLINGFPWSADRTPSAAGLRSAACELDSSCGPTGSFHQKILVVVGSEGPVAFVGGMDFNEDRMTALHDVHCRLRGQAALDLLTIAAHHWNNSAEAVISLGATGSTVDDLSSLAGQSAAATRPRYRVQVVQTIGATTPPGHHADYREAVELAIRNAARYIYVEEQYFWYPRLAFDLADALRTIQHLVLLIPAERTQESYPWTRWGVRNLVERARTNGVDLNRKLHIFQTEDHYCHSKTLIIDDEVAIVGSANMNVRGYESDGEAGVVIADIQDANDWRWFRSTAARTLRTRLWAHHLAVPNNGLLADPIGSIAYWEHPACRSSNVNEYSPDGTSWRSFNFSQQHEPFGPEGQAQPRYMYPGGRLPDAGAH